MSKLKSITQKITLPSSRKTDWKTALPDLLKSLEDEKTELDCNDWELNYCELQELISFIERSGLQISTISSKIPKTIVSASALGHQTRLIIPNSKISTSSPQPSLLSKEKQKLFFHNGTLRSGDNLSTEGDVLLFGDVNPGATISATGNVMVWGRLRGVAHAGKDGNQNMKIIALQLRPLQLRIGKLIARGPEEKPEPGLAEEAKIVGGEIIIEPATTKFHP